jgi:cell division protein FtsQ
MTDRAKKIIRNMFFLLSVPIIIGAYVYAQNSSKGEFYKGLIVTIENPEINFVTKDEVINIFEDLGIYPEQTLINTIDCKEIEKNIENNQWVKSAEIFVSANNFINVKVQQKTPVVRIQQKDSTDYAYYLDEFANPIPLSKKYTPRVSVVTTERLAFTKTDLKMKSAIVQLAHFIDKDTFWSVAISQIDIDAKNQLLLVPMIGTQTIVLGSTDDLENKMARLFTFYQQGINTIKWSLYDEIDLRFKGQIVCRNTRGEILAEDPYAKEIPKAKQDAQKAISIPNQDAAKKEAPKVKVEKTENKKVENNKPESKKVPSVIKKKEVVKEAKKQSSTSKSNNNKQTN